MLRYISGLIACILIIYSFFSKDNQVYYLLIGLCFLAIYGFLTYRNSRVECYICYELVSKKAIKCRNCHSEYDNSYDDCFEDLWDYIERVLGEIFGFALVLILIAFIAPIVLYIFKFYIPDYEFITKFGRSLLYLTSNSYDEYIKTLMIMFGIAVVCIVIGIFNADLKRFNSWQSRLDKEKEKNFFRL